MGVWQLVWRAMVATRMGAVGMRPKMADYAAPYDLAVYDALTNRY